MDAIQRGAPSFHNNMRCIKPVKGLRFADLGGSLIFDLNTEVALGRF